MNRLINIRRITPCVTQGIDRLFSRQSSKLIVHSFHTTSTILAKAKKNDDKHKGTLESVSVSLPDIAVTRKSMDNAIDRFIGELAKIKVGRITADIFNDLHVGSYGTVASAGQVTLKSVNHVIVAVYDPTMLKAVAEAIQESGLGLHPTIENGAVSVFIPKPSKESRELCSKSASRLAEKVLICVIFIYVDNLNLFQSKLEVRNVRKDTLDAIKKCKGVVSDDDAKRANKDVRKF